MNQKLCILESCCSRPFEDLSASPDIDIAYSNTESLALDQGCSLGLERLGLGIRPFTPLIYNPAS